MEVKPVSVISSSSITGFVSTALKYPCPKMFVKTIIWRKIAPPRQLSPRLSISRCILRLSWGSMVRGICFLAILSPISILNSYEGIKLIKNNTQQALSQLG